MEGTKEEEEDTFEELEVVAVLALTSATAVEAHVASGVAMAVVWQLGVTGATLTLGTAAVLMDVLRTILFVGGIAVYAVRNT